MKRFLKVFVPIILSLTILAGNIWYFFVYDTQLTESIFLSCASYFESKDNTALANWFYDRAYEQSANPDAIAVRLANQYLAKGDYTKAEVTLNQAILDGGGANVYIALSNVYVKQDKLLDAMNLLDNISDPTLKKELESMRPPIAAINYPEGDYSTYISLTFESPNNTIYVSTNGQYPSTATDLYQAPITMVQGVNDIRAITVSPNGLVSTLKSYKFTIGGVVEKYTFNDKAMEQAVRSLLQLSPSYEIMTSDLWKIKSFTIPAEAKDYSDLKQMTALETLRLEAGVSDQMQHISKITTLNTLNITKTFLSASDLEAIGNIVSLESLTLDTCMLSTISPLSKLTSLRYFSINNNSLRDIDAITSMTELEELYIHQNGLDDLWALSGCTKLTVLDISNNPDIQSLEPLSTLTMMQRLNITENGLIDISALSNMPELQEFRAPHNEITNVDALTNCLKMAYLDISDNHIADLSPLAPLSEMKCLDFSDNQVTALPAWSVESKLVTINGSNNLIADLTPLAGLQNLNNILMNNNTEIQFIGMLLACPNLIEVFVEKTKVTREEAELLSAPSEEHHAIIVHYEFVTNIEEFD